MIKILDKSEHFYRRSSGLKIPLHLGQIFMNRKNTFGLVQGGSSTYTLTPTYTNLFINQAIELDEPCSRRYETEIMSKRR